MREGRIRLLIGNGILNQERKSALEAAERFRAFDLKVESFEAPERSIWKDRCREQVFSHVFGNTTIALKGGMPFYHPIYPVPNDGALLLGITPQRINRSDLYVSAFTLYGVGAVVSVAALRPAGLPYRGPGPSNDQESAEMIKLALIRELGHSMLGSGPFEMLKPPKDWQRDCKAVGCILEKGADYLSLLRKGQIDFCTSCADNIAGMAIQIKFMGCA